MRIRTDGKHARREDTIDQAAEFWDCNKTTALMQSAEFARRIDERIRQVLARDDLTTAQKREIAETSLQRYGIPQPMIDGSECPGCGGHVSTTNGTDYECDDCGEEFDSADLFLP